MRDLAQLLAAAAVVLLLGWCGYALLFRPAPVVGLRVERLAGAVHGGEGRELRRGETLGSGQRLVTGEDGRAVLALGEAGRVTLEGASSMKVLGRRAGAVEVELEGGRVRAALRSGSPVLGVAAGGAHVVAGDADFGVGLDGDGALSVEASRGAVDVGGLEGVDRLRGGERVLRGPGGQVRVAELSDDLLLDVDWPEAEPGARVVRVAGTTGSFARVEVDGEGGSAAGRADAQGRFSVELPVSAGSNRVAVQAADPMGRTRREGGTVEVPPPPPRGDFEVGYR